MRGLRHKPKRRFVLTPLVDVIFLLVIFFALSSRIAPFVLIPVAGSRAADHEPATASDMAAAPSSRAGREATLVLSRGHIRIGSRLIALDDLAAEASALRKTGQDAALIVTTRSAVTEDVARSLIVLRRAGIAHIRLLARPQAAPANVQRGVP